MNNKLHLHAGRRRAAGTFHPCKVSSGSRARMRPPVAVSLGHAKAPLRAQWWRNPETGSLECHWVPDAGTEPHLRLKAVRRPFKPRMHRRTRSAGLRPPSRLRAHG